MNLKNFLKDISENKNMFINMDIFQALSEIEAHTNNFSLLYGVDIELSFKKRELPKGRDLGVAEELINKELLKKLN